MTPDHKALPDLKVMQVSKVFRGIPERQDLQGRKALAELLAKLV